MPSTETFQYTVTTLGRLSDITQFEDIIVKTDGSRVTRRGFGDTTFRLKYNFWGNDGGKTAFALMAGSVRLDLIVSDVIRTNELEVWFVAEHVVDVPLVHAG